MYAKSNKSSTPSKTQSSFSSSTKPSSPKSKTDLLTEKSKSKESDYKKIISVLSDKSKIQSLSDPTEVESILRKELLLSRSRGRFSGIQNEKHYYSSENLITLTDSPQNFGFSRISGGPEINQRLTNTVALRSIKIRMSWKRASLQVSTVLPRFPTITFLLYRDKVPNTPGTPPTVIGTGSDPPASNALMFDRLGETDTRWNATAIRSPFTWLDFHIYKIEHMDFNSHASTGSLTTGLQTSAPIAEHRVWDIDLHGVQQTYQSAADILPDINDLWFCCYSDIDYTNIGFSDQLHLTADLTFQDVGEQF